MQPVPVITKVVNSHPAYGEVYLIQQYVIKSVSDLRQVGGFLRVLWYHPPIKVTAVNFKDILFLISLNIVCYCFLFRILRHYLIYILVCCDLYTIRIINKKYHIVWTVSKSNGKNYRNRDKIYTLSAQRLLTFRGIFCL
jgi:hypothetical protein